MFAFLKVCFWSGHVDLVHSKDWMSYKGQVKETSWSQCWTCERVRKETRTLPMDVGRRIPVRASGMKPCAGEGVVSHV